MSKIHRIKGRIRSVDKVGHITKAMEKVAASKMRRAQEAALRSRPYSTTARDILARLYRLTSPKDHVLFQRRDVKKQLIILFSSDRGLAGAYNSNLFKLFLNSLALPTDVIAIGQKGTQFVSSLKDAVTVKGVYTNWPTEPSVTDLQPIISTALSSFEKKEVDAVQLLYTDFISTIKQQAVLQTLLPFDSLPLAQAKPPTREHDFLFEPSPQEVLQFIVPRLLEVQIYQANLEAIASEQLMRMVAMKNASDNAEELVEDLTLTFNSARQASITQELAEITVGAAAIQ